jgi:uncharacterized Fe-S cluster-containing radical SAM superfamily protein
MRLAAVEQPATGDRHLVGLIGRTLDNLLPLVGLEKDGELVSPSHVFCPRRREPARREFTDQELRAYQDISAYGRSDPRILLIKSILESVTALIDIEAQGRSVDIDGFRLKDLELWACYESGGLMSNIGAVGAACNHRCDFCYEVGNTVARQKTNASIAEVETRRRYYRRVSNDVGKGLPTPVQMEWEPLMNPDYLSILELVRREYPDEPIAFTTNGSLLTVEKVRRLADFKPITPCVSVNYVTPLYRRRVLKDRSKGSCVALRAIELLREHEIQFFGSIVPWYTVPLDEIEKTIEFLDKYAPLSIRLSLPGYSKHFSPAELFDTEAFWTEVLSLAERLKGRLNTPILHSPHYYHGESMEPVIDGVTFNSPAFHAGLRYKDKIFEINGRRILSKAQLRKKLAEMEASEETEYVELRFTRNGQERGIRFELNRLPGVRTPNPLDAYPYFPRGYTDTQAPPFGIEVAPGFHLTYLSQLADIIDQRKARRVLLFTTPLVRPILVQALRRFKGLRRLVEGVELRITVPGHEFWGGNIMVGDLHVVYDYVVHLRRLMGSTDYRPDLILIPSSAFSEWGVDLVGHSYKRIEREFGIPTLLIPCERVYD